jgi:hypothetical protein
MVLFSPLSLHFIQMKSAHLLLYYRCIVHVQTEGLQTLFNYEVNIALVSFNNTNTYNQRMCRKIWSHKYTNGLYHPTLHCNRLHYVIKDSVMRAELEGGGT